MKNTYYHGFTAQWRLDDIVRGNGCTVLYIQTLDDIFVQSYADLFTDKLAARRAARRFFVPRDRCGLCPDADGGERAVKAFFEKLVLPPRVRCR